jgi:hypothetical protein
MRPRSSLHTDAIRCQTLSSASTRIPVSTTCAPWPNHRCAQLGLVPVFAEIDNLFPWMSDAMDLKKAKNFFETHVIEYQNGAPSAGIEA